MIVVYISAYGPISGVCLIVFVNCVLNELTICLLLLLFLCLM